MLSGSVGLFRFKNEEMNPYHRRPVIFILSEPNSLSMYMCVVQNCVSKVIFLCKKNYIHSSIEESFLIFKHRGF
jgi:hypothetical protein